MTIRYGRANDAASEATTPASEPTSSNNSDPGSLHDQSLIRDADLAAGQIFVIADRAHGRAIAVENGELQLRSNALHSNNCRWRCVKTNGWFGFQNFVSGKFLGHDFWWSFKAEMNHHKNWEYFHAERSGEGNLLLASRLGNFLQITISNDGKGLTTTEDGGTLWEFIRIE
jgi:hypothetical protein